MQLFICIFIDCVFLDCWICLFQNFAVMQHAFKTIEGFFVTVYNARHANSHTIIFALEVGILDYLNFSHIQSVCLCMNLFTVHTREHDEHLLKLVQARHLVTRERLFV